MSEMEWVQWRVKTTGKLTAFAVDGTAMGRTGKARSIDGSLIPPDAAPAEEGTPRDHFCLSIVAASRRAQGRTRPKVRRCIDLAVITWVEWMVKTTGRVTAFAAEGAESPRSVNGSLIPPDAVPAQPGTPRDHFCEEILARAAARPERAPKGAGAPKPAPKPAPPPVVAESDGAVVLRRADGDYEVRRGEGVLGTFAAARLTAHDVPDFRVTSKSWGVYVSGVRRAYGLMPR